MSLYTPPPPPAEPVTTVPLGPDAPWAMQAVVVKKEEDRIVRVEPVQRPKPKPWSTPPTRPAPAVHEGPAPPPAHAPPAWQEPTWAHAGEKKRASSQPEEEPAPRRLVSAANYAAIEADQERYGLIDSVSQDKHAAGTHQLIVHARKKNPEAFRVLNEIRPGSILQARRADRRAGLRVRFTTPARYYSPGSKVTTLTVGVDETDWQSLMADARGI